MYLSYRLVLDRCKGCVFLGNMEKIPSKKKTQDTTIWYRRFLYAKMGWQIENSHREVGLDHFKDFHFSEIREDPRFWNERISWQETVHIDDWSSRLVYIIVVNGFWPKNHANRTYPSKPRARNKFSMDSMGGSCHKPWNQPSGQSSFSGRLGFLSKIKSDFHPRFLAAIRHVIKSWAPKNWKDSAIVSLTHWMWGDGRKDLWPLYRCFGGSPKIPPLKWWYRFESRSFEVHRKKWEDREKSS